MYIYIYTYMYTYMYIYIYTHIYIAPNIFQRAVAYGKCCRDRECSRTAHEGAGRRAAPRPTIQSVFEVLPL